MTLGRVRGLGWWSSGSIMVNVPVKGAEGLPRHSTFIAAAERGDAEELKRQVQMGADVNTTGCDGWTALMLAAYLGDEQLVELLVSRGAQVDARAPSGATALMIAIRNDHVSAALCLLVHWAGVNICTDAGWTPLLLALRSGNPKLVQPLLLRGADVRALDGTGRGAWAHLEQLEQQTGLARPDLRGLLNDYGCRRDLVEESSI